MDLKIAHEALALDTVLYENVLEQPIEAEYLFPDYCPDILRILKCELNPAITSKQANGDKLYLEGTAQAKMMYLSEEMKLVTAETTVSWSRTLEIREIKDTDRVAVRITATQTAGRAISPRKMEVRGTATIAVRVMRESEEKVIVGAEGMGVQLHSKRFTTSKETAAAQKSFTLRDEFFLGSGKPEIAYIVRAGAQAELTDCKVIKDKLVMKGEVTIKALYMSDESGHLEMVEHSLPVSQVVDMDGAHEGDECDVRFTVQSADLIAKTDYDGEQRMVSCQILLMLSCCAYRNEEISCAADAFSTLYESSCQSKNLQIRALGEVVSAAMKLKGEFLLPDAGIMTIYDMWCRPMGMSQVVVGKELTVSGSLCVSMLYEDTDGCAAYAEKTLDYSERIELGKEYAGASSDCEIVSAGVSYNITGTEIDMRLSLRVEGCVYQMRQETLLSNITVDDTKQRAVEDRGALTIYYNDEGESLWEICKRFNTSLQLIVEENSLENSGALSRGMLLIPRL